MIKKRFLSMLVLLCLTVSGAWAQAAAPALNLTSPAVGQVIGDDGKNYDYASLPGGVTAVAKICYVSGEHGLALALTDEGTMNWDTAKTTAAAHTPAFTGGTWKLATQDEWNNMITAAEGYTALRDGFDGITGASNLASGIYWSNTEYEDNSAQAYVFVFANGMWNKLPKNMEMPLVRACLAFEAQGSDPEPTYTVTLKEGTDDANKWEIAPAEATTTGVAAGTEVKATYGGTKKVKSVKAVKKAAADNPAPTTASIEDYTAGTFGWDGDGSAATGLPTINTFAANDKISILSAKNTNTQFTTSEGGASATFSGTAADDSKFYAVYPYTDGLTLSGDVISGVVIPTSQWNSGWNSESNYSGWDPKAPIAYSTTTGSSLTFHNACAILKVTFPEAGVYGRFTISANEPLAGTFSLDTSTGTLTPTSGSTTVTVGTDNYYSSGISTYSSSKTVYVAIAPGTYTGFNLHIYTEDDKEKSITKSTSVTFVAGKIYDLGSYDLWEL